MRRKRDVDRAIATLLGEKQNVVTRITSAFFSEAMRIIIEDGLLHVDGFGRFRLVRERGVRQPLELPTGTFKKGESAGRHPIVVLSRHKVYFSKARPFRLAVLERHGLKEDAMEKFAVDENVDQQQMEKVSAEGCPKCGSKVEKHGNVLACPSCGTEPFEKGKKTG